MATATFSPKGSWGDLRSTASLAVGANKLSGTGVTIELTAAGCAGVAMLPLSFRGVGA